MFSEFLCNKATSNAKLKLFSVAFDGSNFPLNPRALEVLVRKLYCCTFENITTN